MKTKITWIAIVTCLIAATASMQAQNGAPENAPETPSVKKLKPFEREFDTNHNGKLDETEKAAMVAKYDKNGNGKIDKDEMPAKNRIRKVVRKTDQRIRLRSNLLLVYFRTGDFGFSPNSPVLFFQSGKASLLRSGGVRPLPPSG